MTRTLVKVLAVGLLSVLTGCGAAMQTHLFPQTWPAGLNRPSSPKAVPTDRGPVVLVDPVILDVDYREPREEPVENLLTADVLTNLLVEQLRAEGVNAFRRDDLTSEPDYVLSGTVPRLVWTERPGYPRRLQYVAQLACHLIDQRNRQVLWQRDLEHVFDRWTVVDTMTRLPDRQREHGQILVEKCIVPVWNIMASGVRTSLREAEAGATKPEER